MANPYYSYSGNILPGSQGRAEVVAAEFQSVQAGFADLATAGVDSGTQNTYIVTTPVGEPAAYADGDEITFKPLNTNSGASTINVNGAGVASILRFDGSGMQADDILGGSWYTLTYNSTYSAWTLPSSTSTITFAGTISTAAPVYPVQLTAVGGSSTSAMPIDAKLAISTAISPTWVGNHTFNGTTTFAGPTTISGTAVVSGPLSISGLTTHSAGVAFTGPASFAGTATVSGVLAVSGTSTFSGPVVISGTSTASGPWSFTNNLTVSGTASISGNLTVSGTATASAPWSFTNKLVVSGTASFSGAFTASGTSTFSGPLTVSGTASFSSQVTFAQPITVFGVSGTGTVVIGKSGNPSLAISAPAGNYALISLAGNGNAIGSTDFEIYQSTVGDAYVQQNATGGSLNFQTSGVTRVTINSSGAVVITSPASGTGLYVNGATGTHSTQIEDSAGNGWNAGYLEIPQNTFGTSYASVREDSGKSQYHNSASAHTFTINDATVNYNKGATITVINEVGGGTVTIALQTTPANLIWSPSLSTGNRSLAAGGIATVTKVTAGTPGVWFIAGGGIT